jgi:hypothetical protein
MLSRPQQILLKRAQREVALPDGEYREALELVSGCRSSTAPAMTDHHLDLLMGYFEAIHWRKVDAGELQQPCRADAVFRQRGYWAGKNTRRETSRDRFTNLNLGQAIAGLESQLATLGYSAEYCTGIRRKAAKGRTDEHALHLYRAALQRTFNAKARRKEAVENPV